MAITPFTTPYPDFKNNEVINPDEFDANSLAILNKLNELIGRANTVESSNVMTFTTLTLSGGATVSLGRTPRYTKTPFGEVVIEGEIAPLAANGVTIATLPTGFRPPVLRSFKVSHNSSVSNDGATIYVETDGRVYVHAIANTTTGVSLNGIRFFVN